MKFIEEEPEEKYIDIRVYIDRVVEHTIYDDGTGEEYVKLTPVHARYWRGDVDLREIEGLGERLHQSDFGQIQVKDALLHALGGGASGIKRN